MADMKEALATLGVSPERIHAEIFNGGESLTPGVVIAATRSPHPPKADGNLICCSQPAPRDTPHPCGHLRRLRIGQYLVFEDVVGNVDPYKQPRVKHYRG